MSCAEVLYTAEQHLGVGGGPDKPFVAVKVTVDEEGNASFDAFQVSKQCLEMCSNGALQDSTDEKFCSVNETFTAIVEGKGVEIIDNNFFLVVVAINHFTADYSCSFPKLNRVGSSQSREALMQTLTDKSGLPTFADRIADLELLLFLCEFLDINQEIPAICTSVANRAIPIDEGYQLIIESISGMS